MPTQRRNYDGRGRHRKATSRETVRWEREHLPPAPALAPELPQRLPPPPAAPSWMDAATAERLYALRRELPWS
jgi:hypothetical protein